MTRGKRRSTTPKIAFHQLPWHLKKQIVDKMNNIPLVRLCATQKDMSRHSFHKDQQRYVKVHEITVFGRNWSIEVVPESDPNYYSRLFHIGFDTDDTPREPHKHSPIHIEAEKLSVWDISTGEDAERCKRRLQAAGMRVKSVLVHRTDCGAADAMDFARITRAETVMSYNKNILDHPDFKKLKKFGTNACFGWDSSDLRRICVPSISLFARRNHLIAFVVIIRDWMNGLRSLATFSLQFDRLLDGTDIAFVLVELQADDVHTSHPILRKITIIKDKNDKNVENFIVYNKEETKAGIVVWNPTQKSLVFQEVPSVVSLPKRRSRKIKTERQPIRRSARIRARRLGF